MMTVPAGSAGGKRARRTTSEVETDSEIEQLIRIPASQRSQSQRDLVYSYVSTVSLGRECGQELRTVCWTVLLVVVEEMLYISRSKALLNMKHLKFFGNALQKYKLG